MNAPDILYPDKTAYFGGKLGTSPGDVVAINASNGRLLWDTKVPGDPTGGVTVVNGLVVTATYQGTMVALDRRDRKDRLGTCVARCGQWVDVDFGQPDRRACGRRPPARGGGVTPA